ncbi:ubiquitin carboxyl-terminal hydrolase [Trypanosoma rangeli SC58]|uniref:Ubiquitin carboxyl-terminal hydrolase n=1 Tax=Trypanosoma rangeli SC58 TaxID=429131 RepID=A0A061J2A8_TRYRA|nr:ubiquitin carboxyl-terminal hydrolase [Trypanosoma rangeli SC58]
MSKCWLPIESNPDVMNAYLESLGVINPKVEFCDVYGIDPEMLDFVPRPVRAMILLYPISPEMDAGDVKEREMRAAEIMELLDKNELFFSRQTVENACGTMAILHAVMNNLEYVGELRKDSPLDYLRRVGLQQTPEERAALIEAHSELDQAHMDASVGGVTPNQPIDAQIDLHFTCFVHANGKCVELDGRKPCPLSHAACVDNEGFVRAAAEAIQAKMLRDTDSFRFNILALVHKSE